MTVSRRHCRSDGRGDGCHTKMNDPQITVQYRIDHEDVVNYSEAKAVCEEAEDFSIRLEEGRAYFVMRCECTTVEAAKAVVNPYIDSWELGVALTGMPGQFKLKFEKAEIRDPKTGSVQHFVDAGQSRWQFSVPVIPGPYPKPPIGVALNPSHGARLMFDRYERYCNGRTELTNMAYYCLTVMRDLSNGHDGDVKRKYRVSENVIDEFRHLANTGGSAERRKEEHVNKRDLHPDERLFLVEAVKKFIRRVAEVAQSPDEEFPVIPLSELPKLPRDTAST